MRRKPFLNNPTRKSGERLCKSRSRRSGEAHAMPLRMFFFDGQVMCDSRLFLRRRRSLA